MITLFFLIISFIYLFIYVNALIRCIDEKIKDRWNSNRTVETATDEPPIRPTHRFNVAVKPIDLVGVYT